MANATPATGTLTPVAGTDHPAGGAGQRPNPRPCQRLNPRHPSEGRAVGITDYAFSAAVSFLFLVLVFRPLELAFPAKPRPAVLPPGVVDGPVLLPRPVPALERRGALAAVALRRLARRHRAGRLPRGRRGAAVVAAGDRGHPAQRLLRLLGPPPPAPRRLPLAVPLGPPQRRAPRLAGRPPRAPARHGLHDGPDQPAGVRPRLPAARRSPA